MAQSEGAGDAPMTSDERPVRPQAAATALSEAAPVSAQTPTEETPMPQVISCDSHVHVQPNALRAYLRPQAARQYDAAVAAVAAERQSLLQGADMAKMTRMRRPASGRPGSWDPKARLADMDSDGVAIEVLFPEVSDFTDFHLLGPYEQEARAAYNQCLHDFASAAPERLIPTPQIGIHDITQAVADVQRFAAEGARLLQIPLYPTEVGAADYWDERYEPLWHAIEDAQLPLAQHITMKPSMLAKYHRDPTPQFGLTIAQVPFGLSENVGGWILSGILEKHPGLRIVICEPLIGWLPAFLDLLDDMSSQGYEFPALQDDPSAYFHRQMYVTFINDPRAITMRHEVGVERMLWSSDYPHPASMWPESSTRLAQQLAEVPNSDRTLMLNGNSARLFNLPPLAA
jgi:uncharacterized protein